VPRTRSLLVPVILALLASLLVAVVVSPGTANAASQTFTVTTTADSGAGSLRDAVTSAQLTSDEDTIVFDGTTFAPGSLHTITLASTLPVITKPLNIVGPGQQTLAISGNDAVRILTIDQGNNTPPGISVRISDLTLTRGKPATGNGGAIYAYRAAVTLARVTVSRSQAAQGGGAYMSSGSLTVIDSVFEDDTATSRGGAIRNDHGDTGEAYSFVSIQGSTLRRNHSNGDGGAVYAARPLHVTNSTITQNSSGDDGGGLWIGYGFHHTVTGSSITSNTAVDGGGFSLGQASYKGLVTIQNSTITDNTTSSGVGGGLWIGSMIVKLINNTISNGASGNCKPIWGELPGNSLIYSNVIDISGSSISDNTCSQLDRAVTVTSWTGAANGGTSVVQASSDPPFIAGDRVRFCAPNDCSLPDTKTGVVTSVSTADDTFAVTAEGTVTAWAGLSGMYGGAWVNLPKLWSVTPSSGDSSGGTSVTVTGTGFGSPSATPTPTVGLTFGGISATGITVIDDSTILATTPAGSGSVAVGASSNANTANIASTVLAGAFTYPGAPGPTPPPVYAPSPPTGVAASPLDGGAAVTWEAPSSTGSYPVSTYQVQASPGGRICLTSALTCSVAGLSNGTAYSFTVRALNGAGWSSSSEPSDSVTPRAVPKPTFVITGSREGARMAVSGSTTGMGMGGLVTPWTSRSLEDFISRAAIPVSADGTFEWSRRASRSVVWRVYFTAESGRSNTVTIR
jgi:hypothetical protein